MTLGLATTVCDTYVGSTLRDGTCEVVLMMADGSQAGTLPHFVRHSPTGLTCGQVAPGTTDLALSMLAHATGEEPETRVYRKFANTVLAKVGGGFTLERDFVLDWYREHA